MDIETGIAFVLYGLVLLANVVIAAQHTAHIKELEKKVEVLTKSALSWHSIRLTDLKEEKK